MKKYFALLLVLTLALSLFSACGKKEEAPKTEDPAEISGEVFDGGNVSALVPKGWMAFHGSDIFEEYEEGYDPNCIQIAKDAESEWDLFSKPYIQIDYYGPDEELWEPSKDFYDDAADLEPVTLGAYTWSGFTGKSMDMPIAVLWAVDGDDEFQLTMWLETDEAKISLEDADVQAIIASIQPN